MNLFIFKKFTHPKILFSTSIVGVSIINDRKQFDLKVVMGTCMFNFSNVESYADTMIYIDGIRLVVQDLIEKKDQIHSVYSSRNRDRIEMITDRAGALTVSGKIIWFPQDSHILLDFYDALVDADELLKFLLEE